MKKYELRSFVMELFDSENAYSTKEVLAIARQKFSIEQYTDKQIITLLYNLQKEKKICRTKDGKYKKAVAMQKLENEVFDKEDSNSLCNISLKEYIKKAEGFCICIDEMVNAPGILNKIDDKQIYDIYRLNKLNRKIMLELSQYKKMS